MSVLTLAMFHVFFFILLFMLLHWWHFFPSCYAVSLNQMCSLSIVTGYRLCEWGNRNLIHSRSRHVALQNQDSYWCQRACCPVDITVFKAGVKQPGCGTDSHNFFNFEVKIRGAIHFQGMVLNLCQTGLVFKLQHIINDKSMNVSWTKIQLWNKQHLWKIKQELWSMS